MVSFRKSTKLGTSFSAENVAKEKHFNFVVSSWLMMELLIREFKLIPSSYCKSLKDFSVFEGFRLAVATEREVICACRASILANEEYLYHIIFDHQKLQKY